MVNMSAIEPSITLFRGICELSETRIDDHFRKVDALEDKSKVENLKIASLAEEIAATLGVKQQECVYTISLYLRNRPDLELRAGTNGGICRVGDKAQKAPMTPKECALRHYELVKGHAFTVINDEFIKAKEVIKQQGLVNKQAKLNFQQLCDIIADKANLKYYVVYHCIREYIEEERVDLVIELGRYGGLVERES